MEIERDRSPMWVVRLVGEAVRWPKIGEVGVKTIRVYKGRHGRLFYTRKPCAMFAEESQVAEARSEKAMSRSLTALTVGDKASSILPKNRTAFTITLSNE